MSRTGGRRASRSGRPDGPGRGWWWIRSVACVMVLIPGFIGVLTGVASASLVDGMSVVDHVPLPGDRSVPVTPDNTEFVVMTVPISLQEGQYRRISDQLTLTVSDYNQPEVDNDLVCFDPSGAQAGDP